MTFPFPKNPVDGQVATQNQADGTVLVATYQQAKNEWVISRQTPKNPTLMLTAGTAYTVTPGTDGQVLTYDATLNQWVAKTPAAGGGGLGGGTFIKGKQTDPDTTNPPDPTKPKDLLQQGFLQSTIENLHHELKAWNGTAWVNVFSEDEIKQWIAAGSLFRSTLLQAGIASLPAPATANRGYYWTWAGASGYVVKAGDTPLAPALVGEVLNPGDWIQSDGTKYVHVSGDLLSKQRWINLGSFLPWSDTSWESGSVVSYQKSFFRSTTNVVAGDAAPGTTSTGAVTSGTTLRFSMPDSLADGTLITIALSPAVGAPITFNYTTVAGDGVASILAGHVQAAMLAAGAVSAFGTAALAPGYSVDLTAKSGTFSATADNGITVGIQAGGVATGNKWVDITPLPSMGLADLKGVNANVTDPDLHGAVFQWDDLINEWVASDVLQIGAVRFGDAGISDEITAFEATDFSVVPAADETGTVASIYAIKEYVKGQPKPFLEELEDCIDLRGATDGEVPSWDDTNSKWVPKTLSADLAGLTDTTITTPATDEALVFDGPTSRWVNKAIPRLLTDLADVTETTPATGNLLRFNVNHWENWVPDYLSPANGYTKTEVDNKISAVVTGLEHYEAVLSRLDTPPAAPALNDLYLINASPTGFWVGQANNLARWDGTAWQFETPKANETHLVEDESALYHWNGTAWVKIASTVAASGSSASSGVGEIIAWPLDTFPTTDYLECNGQIVAVAAYADLHNVIGNKYNAGTAADGVTTFALPDLRGFFLRGTGANGGEATAGRKQNDTTRMPRTAFTVNRQGDHNHSVGIRVYGGDANSPLVGGYPTTSGGTNKVLQNIASNYSSTLPGTNTTGGHTHDIAGGDGETRPISFSVKWLIRFKAINGGAKGSTGTPGAGVPATGTEGQTIVYKAGSWVADAPPTGMIGDIKQTWLTTTQFIAQLPASERNKWVLADGRDVTGTRFATVTGSTHVPDLRGAFLRGAGTHSNTIWQGGAEQSWHEYKTARPSTAFQTTSDGAHSHVSGQPCWDVDYGAFFGRSRPGGAKSLANFTGTATSPTSPVTSTVLGHFHTIDSGGDAETVPRHYSINFFIKVD